jgi:signal transduction histidine kinase
LEERVRLRTEELRKAQSELEIRSQRLATILELSPDGFAEITPEQRIGFVNGAFEKITGMMATKISGVTLSDFTAQLSQLQEAEGLPRERWISVILENTKSSDELAVVRLRQPNDRVIAVGLYATGFSGRLIYVRDVTREAELDRMKTDFLSTAAHELRTPLASISGYSELLLKKQFESNQQKELLSVIHRHAQSMTALVNDLLEIVRAEARVGRNYLMQVQPITPLVRRVVEDFRLADDPRTPIQRLDEHLPAVLIDSERIRQVINNLLSNAVKYSEAGSPIEVATVIRQIDAAQWVGFRIKDYGIGMSQEEQAHLFERFYRANPQGPVPGTGLGMALIKEIIDQHRGKIEFDSALGKGSAVTVLFPAVTAAA